MTGRVETHETVDVHDTIAARDADAGAPATTTPRTGWERLLRASGAAEAVALLGVAAWLADVEAALVGVGVGVALALLRVRRGRLGAALLGLLSLNVLAWMALSTASTLANGDGVATLVIPATLTALAVLGVLAAVAVLARRGVRHGSAAPAVVATVVGTALAATLLTGALTSSGTEVTTHPDDLALASERLQFTETRLEADAGEVGVVLENGDLFWHTFTIDELGVDLAVPVGATRRVAFSAEPGTYTFYCRVPGHETVMRGTLTVR